MISQDETRNVITPRGIEMDISSALPFDAVRIARDLLRTTRTASLATLDPETGYPYVTVTNLAVEADGTPYFFVAMLALHARNLDSDNRISISLSPADSRDVLNTPRLTLVGRALPVPEDESPTAGLRYLRRFPKAKLYLGLPDARLYRMHVEDLTLSGGPARNAFSTLTPHSLRTDTTAAAALLAAETEELAKLNADPANTRRLAAVAGAEPQTESERWSVTGIDPDGLDLQSNRATARLWFKKPVSCPFELQAQLKPL